MIPSKYDSFCNYDTASYDNMLAGYMSMYMNIIKEYRSLEGAYMTKSAKTWDFQDMSA